jgi:hypothetical protein
MTELLEKDKQFDWMPTCQPSFQELKKRLTTAPILVMADMEKSFSVIPRSEKEGTKPPYVCPGCSNHTHGNNMINRCNVIK